MRLDAQASQDLVMVGGAEISAKTLKLLSYKLSGHLI